MVTRAHRMSRAEDPKARIMREIEATLRPWGWVIDTDLAGIDRMQPLTEKAGIRVFGPDYLIAIYERSGQYTSGQVLVPPSYMEDRIQGKMGLVVGVGPLCQGEEYENWFGGNPPRVGDWVVTSIRDGLTFVVGGMAMKLVEWKYLRMTSFEPDLIV